MPLGIEEAEASVREGFDLIAALVNKTVVGAAEAHKIFQRR